jgi:hypothetical protein
MAGTLATILQAGSVTVWTGGAAQNAGDVCFDADVGRYDAITFFSTAGAVEALVSLDGTTFNTTPVSSLDVGVNAAGVTYVNVSVAGRVYRVAHSAFRRLRLRQNGATGVAGLKVTASVKGRPS